MYKNRRVQFNRHFPRDQQPLCSTLPPSECQVVLQHVCIYRYAPHHSWMGAVFLFCFFNYSEVQTRATENKAMHMKWSKCHTHPVYRNGSLLLGTLHKGEKLFWHAGDDRFWRRSPMKSLCGAAATWITIGCNTAFNTSPPRTVNRWGDCLQRPDYKTSKTCWPSHTAARHVLSVTIIVCVYIFSHMYADGNAWWHPAAYICTDLFALFLFIPNIFFNDLFLYFTKSFHNSQVHGGSTQGTSERKLMRVASLTWVIPFVKKKKDHCDAGFVANSFHPPKPIFRLPVH